MPDMDYLTVDQLKAVLGISKPQFDDALQLAISAASRQIDEHCNDQFWKDDAPTARIFQVSNARRLMLPSFATTSGLVVAVDMDDNGSFETTWTAGVNYQATPPSPRPGWPFTELVTLGSSYFPGARDGYFGRPDLGFTSPGYYRDYGYGNDWYPNSQRARVQVTATWGWPSVPAPVVQACQVQAIDYFKSKELTGSSYGGMATGIRGYLSGCNEMACALLMSYRSHVVA